MKENLLREVLEAELLVDDKECVNGCENVEFKNECRVCGVTQDLEPRSIGGKIDGIIDVWQLVSK